MSNELRSGRLLAGDLLVEPSNVSISCVDLEVAGLVQQLMVVALKGCLLYTSPSPRDI